MPPAADISICIPTRNQAGTLAETLHSAFAQTRPAREVLVSDDAGTDDTPRVVEAFRAGLPAARRDALRYVRHATALGMGANFDYAVRGTRGAYCVKVDSDDMLEPAFVERLADQLDRHPTAGWAHPNVLNITPDGAPIMMAHTRKQAGFAAAPDIFRQYLRHNDTCHCVLLRRDAYEAAGGYRPALRTCEDWMLWLDMSMAGFGTVYVDEALARMRKYRHREELMSRRRLEFVESADMMVANVQRALTPEKARTLGVDPAAAVRLLRRSVGAHVYFAALMESDAAVRRRLLDALVAFAPTAHNRTRRWAGRNLPVAVVRLPAIVSGRARDAARQMLQRCAKARPPTGIDHGATSQPGASAP